MIDGNKPIKLRIQKKEPLKTKLKIQKTVDGRIFIKDHPDIDIVIHPEELKIVTFPKEEMSDYVYGSQDLFFEFLVKQGLVLPDTVQGGSVYYSIEGIIPPSETQINPIDMVVFNIGKFIDKERIYFKKEEDYKDAIDRSMYDPDEDESTELGEVEHEEYKGVIPRSGRPYGYGSTFGFFYEDLVKGNEDLVRGTKERF